MSSLYEIVKATRVAEKSKDSFQVLTVKEDINKNIKLGILNFTYDVKYLLECDLEELKDNLTKYYRDYEKLELNIEILKDVYYESNMCLQFNIQPID